jgi:hypothetical protein
MAFFGSGFNNSNGNINNFNTNLARHIYEFIGETVTIFTTSGGASGNGFTGVVLSVNQNFVRLMTEQGTPPTNPINNTLDVNINNFGFDGIGSTGMGGNRRDNNSRFGSVCDIPIENIAAFCHNAV